MLTAIYCLLQHGLVSTELFYHVLLPIMVSETVLEMVLINVIDNFTLEKKHEKESS